MLPTEKVVTAVVVAGVAGVAAVAAVAAVSAIAGVAGVAAVAAVAALAAVASGNNLRASGHHFLRHSNQSFLFTMYFLNKGSPTSIHLSFHLTTHLNIPVLSLNCCLDFGHHNTLACFHHSWNKSSRKN